MRQSRPFEWEGCFDAIPGLKVTGKVSRPKPLGENKQGDMTFVVIVAPDQVGPRLHWNMTASVAIEPR
jgi:HlyD family secretion protein